MTTLLFSPHARADLTPATFSVPDRLYRYTLPRIVSDHTLPPMHVVFIGLNPSTADETKDDATIRKLRGFVRRWQYSAMQMLNIFAYRSTDPYVLKSALDPVGANNDETLRREVSHPSAGLIVACWGRHGALFDRGQYVLAMLRQIGRPIHCFGLNKDGSPVHPLYQRDETPLRVMP